MSREFVWAAVRRANDPSGAVARVFRDVREKLPDHLGPGEMLKEVDGPIDTSAWRFDDAGELVAFVPTVVERLETELVLARRERDMRLGRTDWIELPSNRARKTPEFVEALDAYRQNARDAVARVKDGLDPAWTPDEPTD